MKTAENSMWQGYVGSQIRADNQLRRLIAIFLFLISELILLFIMWAAGWNWTGSIALTSLPVAFAAYYLRGQFNYSSNPIARHLEKYGPLPVVVKEIDHEMLDCDSIGKIIITRSWLIDPRPLHTLMFPLTNVVSFERARKPFVIHAHHIGRTLKRPGTQPIVRIKVKDEVIEEMEVADNTLELKRLLGILERRTGLSLRPRPPGDPENWD